MPPTLTEGFASGSTVTLYYSETLDRLSTPAAGDFVVTAGGSSRTASGVSVHANAVTLAEGGGAGLAEARSPRRTPAPKLTCALLSDPASCVSLP